MEINLKQYLSEKVHGLEKMNELYLLGSKTNKTINLEPNSFKIVSSETKILYKSDGIYVI